MNTLVLGQKYRSILSSFLRIEELYGPPPLLCKLMIKNVLDWIGFPSEQTWTDQWTHLHWAAHNGHFDICELLISRMSWKNPGDKTGWTPLHSAAQNGHLRVVKLILSYFSASNEYPIPYSTYGICRVFWYDMFGITPLKLATQYHHEEIRTAIQEFIFDNKVRRNPGLKELYIQKILEIQNSVQEDNKDRKDKKDEDFNVLEEGDYYTTEDNDDSNDNDDYDDNTDNDDNGDNEVQGENKDLEIQEEEYSGVEEEKDKDLVFQEKEVDVIEGNDQAPAKRRRMTMTFRA